MQNGSGANTVFSKRWWSPSSAVLLLVATCIANTGISYAAGSEAKASPHVFPGAAKADGLHARILSWPDLEKFYPADAKARGLAGMVRMAVTLDKEGRATNTQLLSVTPPDKGFGAAASTAVHFMKFSNPTGHDTTIKFAVKFALEQHRPRHHHVHRT